MECHGNFELHPKMLPSFHFSAVFVLPELSDWRPRTAPSPAWPARAPRYVVMSPTSRCGLPPNDVIASQRSPPIRPRWWERVDGRASADATCLLVSSAGPAARTNAFPARLVTRARVRRKRRGATRRDPALASLMRRRVDGPGR